MTIDWKRAIALTVVTCGALTAVVAAARPPAPAVPAGLERFYAQELVWGPCRDFASNDIERGAFAAPGYDCASLEVPLDYAKPDGRLAAIAVLRQRTTGSRIGSLVINPGGPGASGMQQVTDKAPGLANGPLREHFDLIGFDPRGVGASTPTLACAPIGGLADRARERSEPVALPAVPDHGAVPAVIEAAIQRCIQHSGGIDVLANVGTREVVKDLDILRAALGDEKLTYLGYSYGTKIGAAYAEAFPQNVRALVLDGPIDPSESTRDDDVRGAVAYQRSFDALAAGCATQPDCPLGTDPAASTAAFQAMTRPLAKNPITAGARSIDHHTVVELTPAVLRDPSTWPAFLDFLRTLAHHAPPGEVIRAFDRAANTDRTGGSRLDPTAHRAIRCVDEDRITNPGARSALQREQRAAAPFLDSGEDFSVSFDECVFWPVPPTTTAHVPRISGLPPVLVVASTGDPATPYAGGARLAELLAARLLTVEGYDHGVSMGGNACVDDTVNAYLLEHELPPTGKRCAA